MKNLKTRKLEKSKKQQLAKLDQETKELLSRAYDLIAEYVDCETLELDDIAAELAEIKKRYYEVWLEADKLM